MPDIEVMRETLEAEITMLEKFALLFQEGGAARAGIETDIALLRSRLGHDEEVRAWWMSRFPDRGDDAYDHR